MNKLILAVLATCAIACNSPKTETQETSTTNDSTMVGSVPKEEMLLKINQNNQAITSSSDPDSLRFIYRGQAEMCAEFVKNYSSDPIAPEILSYQGNALRALGQYKEAVDVYSQLEQRYPEYVKLDEILFIKAFILDNEINDNEAAEKAYFTLIQKFPKSQYTKDAKTLMTQLHMTDAELMQMIENKNKGSKK